MKAVNLKTAFHRYFIAAPVVILAVTAAALVSSGGPALAGTTQAAHDNGAPVKNVCGHLLPAKYLAAGKNTVARPSAAEVAAAARYKARHDPGAARLRRVGAAYAAHNAQKTTLLRSGKLPLRHPDSAPCAAQFGGSAMSAHSLAGSGSATISWMYQYGQIKGWYCGPATVEEVSATVPGSSPVGLDQNALASDMGTTENSGTGNTAVVTELNNIVGVPDFGWSYYGWVGMDYNPTDSQRTAFITDLKGDVGNSSPVVGDGWEVPGGPHLVGHPVGEEIKHYFEIGGYNDFTSQVWYADSATTVWSGVPAYSWFDTYTMETILGGMGFIW